MLTLNLMHDLQCKLGFDILAIAIKIANVVLTFIIGKKCDVLVIAI
jgi:hypothetical protein